MAGDKEQRQSQAPSGKKSWRSSSPATWTGSTRAKSWIRSKSWPTPHPGQELLGCLEGTSITLELEAATSPSAPSATTRSAARSPRGWGSCTTRGKTRWTAGGLEGLAGGGGRGQQELHALHEGSEDGGPAQPSQHRRRARHGVDQKTPYYAMEFIDGETLADILDRLEAKASRTRPTLRSGSRGCSSARRSPRAREDIGR